MLQDVPHPTGLTGLFITLRSQVDNLLTNLFGWGIGGETMEEWNDKSLWMTGRIPRIPGNQLLTMVTNAKRTKYQPLPTCAFFFLFFFVTFCRMGWRRDAYALEGGSPSKKLLTSFFVYHFLPLPIKKNWWWPTCFVETLYIMLFLIFINSKSFVITLIPDRLWQAFIFRIIAHLITTQEKFLLRKDWFRIKYKLL